MPDDLREAIQKSLAGAAFAAVLVMLAACWPWRKPHPVRSGLGSVLGVGMGIALGVYLLNAVPKYPPSEDKDRLLLILLPAALVIEIAAVFLRRLAWLPWVPRLALAAVTARVVLHGSTFIASSGNEPPNWSTTEAWLILTGLGLALAAEWFLLDRLAARESGGTALLSLALANGTAGIAVMLSGYAYGGHLGFPFAAAIAGVAIASFVVARPRELRGAVGIGLVALFALIVSGRFFGDLTTTNALLLFCSPLAGWLPELVPALRERPTLRRTIRPILVALPAALALTLAGLQFVEDSKAKSSAPGSDEPGAEDYLNFGK
jgi:hypothetical protein